MGLTWLAARPSRKGWATHAGLLRKEGRGRRGQTRRAMRLQQSLSFMAGRGSGARGVCSRVVVVYVAEIDRQCRTQRSVRSQLHPIWGAHGDGGLARSLQASAETRGAAVACEAALRAESMRKPIT